jgi:protein-tyrosine phosphatase
MAVVLFICTGNLCRSPSAEGMLAQRLTEFGPHDVTVESAGTMGTSSKVPAELRREGAAYGLDLSLHAPRRVDAESVFRADLVIGMERSHVREIALAHPPSFTKTFTLREIVRRGRSAGQRRSSESLAEWLDQIGASRRHAELIGDSPLDDIADPMGGTSMDYRQMLMEVKTLTRALHSLTWPRSEVSS